jgi:chorismate synthase
MAIMSVQAIKGVEVGDAFENARRIGTEAHDPINLQRSTFDLQRSTNRAGGTEGGVSNGQPIIIRAAMKPIATTLMPQQTVDLAVGENAPTKYERSDFCPVPRAVPILEAMVAFVLAEALIEKLGGDSMNEMKPRFDTLRKATLEDLPMDNIPHIFWE